MSEDEFELTFLAKEFPEEIKGITPKKMVDIYVPENSPHPHLRIRQNGQRYEITSKKPLNKDSSHQIEHTIILEPEEYQALSKASNMRIEKDRYLVKINGFDAEVDVFDGHLTGLVLIDFEFKSTEDKSNFKAPACCLADVTQEEFIAGGKLAGKSYEDIEPSLTKFAYARLRNLK